MTDPTPISGTHAEDCPCIQRQCTLWGNCVKCVRAHRTHGEHIPECLQPLFRDLVEKLAARVEYGVVEARPGETEPTDSADS